jgi:hypothetical protein
MKQSNYKPLTDYIIEACYGQQKYILDSYMSMFYVFIAMFLIKIIKRILLRFNIRLKFYNKYSIPMILFKGEIDILDELIDFGNIYIYAMILNVGLYVILR